MTIPPFAASSEAKFSKIWMRPGSVIDFVEITGRQFNRHRAEFSSKRAVREAHAHTAESEGFQIALSEFAFLHVYSQFTLS